MNIISIASSSKGNAHIIESTGEKLLLDCGVPLKKIREKIGGFGKVVACLVSHEHGDHFNGKLQKETAVDIYCTEGTKKRFKLSNSCFVITDNQFLTISAEFAVKTVKLSHDQDCECLGFLIKTRSGLLFYATDTSEVNYQFPGLTHLMIESNYSFEKLIESEHNKSVVKRICETHLSIDQVAEFVKRHKDLTEIHLLHLSSANSDERLFKETIQDVAGVPVFVAGE